MSALSEDFHILLSHARQAAGNAEDQFSVFDSAARVAKGLADARPAGDHDHNRLLQLAESAKRQSVRIRAVIEGQLDFDQLLTREDATGRDGR